MKRLLLILGLAFGLISTIVLFNAVNLRPRAVDVPAATAFKIDSVAASERLAGALRFQTVSRENEEEMDGQPFLGLHAYFEQQFPRLHAALNRETVSQYSLLYTWPGSDTRLAPVLLLAHLDVVPPETQGVSVWTHAPFSGDVVDGFVWGRGALDDKSAAMAQMEAVEMLLAEGFQPKRTLYLAYGHDEEVGGADGAARISDMLEHLGVSPGLVLDEGGTIVKGSISGLDIPVALVGVAEKGYLSLLLTAEGQGGHSSMPPPNTTVGVIAHAVAKLEDNPMPARITPSVRELFEHIGPRMSLARRLLFGNLWLSRPLIEYMMTKNPPTDASLRTTTAATMFSGSPQQNVLPAKAAAVVNFRILPGDTRKSVLAHATKVIGDSRVSISPLSFSSEPSAESPSSGEAYELLDTTIRQTMGGDDLEVSPYLVVTATDSRYYARLSPRIYRFQPQRLAPEDIARIHGTNERISVKNYTEMIHFYYQLLRNVNEVH
nr:succinyl-diaminopimelate desuccinylase [uncultured bacterium]